jgi:hypothetical protein
VTAPITWWETFSHDAGHLMRRHVHGVMNNAIDAGRRNLFTGLVY